MWPIRPPTNRDTAASSHNSERGTGPQCATGGDSADVGTGIEPITYPTSTSRKGCGEQIEAAEVELEVRHARRVHRASLCINLTHRRTALKVVQRKQRVRNPNNLRERA